MYIYIHKHIYKCICIYILYIYIIIHIYVWAVNSLNHPGTRMYVLASKSFFAASRWPTVSLLDWFMAKMCKITKE